MFCAHDPGFALFLSEHGEDFPKPGFLEWGALGGTVALAVISLFISV